MNLSSLVGLIFTFTVLYLGVFSKVADRMQFFDPQALILVLGGTIAVAMISYPSKTLKHLLRFSLLGFLFKIRKNDFSVGTQLLEVHFACLTSQIGPKTQIDEHFHPFLGEGLSLLKRRKFSTEELRSILNARIDLIKKVYQNDGKMIAAIAKFPPALGLLGACAGMIAMLSSAKGGTELLAPSMATALVSSFWGLAISNLFLLPLADYAMKVSLEEVHTREMIAEALLLIQKNESSHVVFEKVAGYLPISDRVRFRDVFKDIATSHGESHTSTTGKPSVA